MLKNSIAVFFGGGVGVTLRYLLICFLSPMIRFNFPIITFFINILACIMMGFLFTILTEKVTFDDSVKLAATLGFCGGFSTFTALSLEMLKMIEKTQIIQSIIYVTLTIVLGLLATWIGVYAAKSL